MRKISRFREIVTLACLVLLLALIAAKIERDNEIRLSGLLRAIDGDSLVLGETRMRLLGIDAPEFFQTCQRNGKPWDCGRAVHQALTGFVTAKSVVCAGSKHDKYSRLLVICSNGDQDINQQMVLTGMAVSFGSYESEEQQAKAARRGIWSGSFVLPSEWRAQHHHQNAYEEPHKAGS